MRPLMYHPFNSYLRFMVIFPQIAQEHVFTSYAQLDPIILCYTLARIKSDPLYFLKDTAYQFWELLTYSTFLSISMHDALQQYLDNYPPVLPSPVPRHDKDYGLREKALKDTGFESEVFATSDNAIRVPPSRSQSLVFALRFFQLLAAVYMAAGIILFMRRVWGVGRIIPEHFSPLAIIGIAFYLQMGVIAATEMALPRYVFPLWPMMCTAIIMR